MKLGELPLCELRRHLARDGLSIDCGLVRTRVRGNLPGFAEALQLLYAAYDLDRPPAFHDVTVTLRLRRDWRARMARQVEFVLDGDTPFDPLPAAHHLPMYEWGLNWSIASRCHRHLLLHAGAVARDGLGLLIPAVPGTGKSTLTAALTQRGYRLLSDEFGVVRLSDQRLLPAVRPVALKNASIAVMRRFAPQAVIGPTYRNTRKGDVAHLAPDAVSVAARHEPAVPVMVLFPQYRRGATLAVESVDPAMAFIKLSANSFNYELLGERSFNAVAKLAQGCRAYRVTYDSLDEAVGTIDELLADCRQPLAVGQ